MLACLILPGCRAPSAPAPLPTLAVAARPVVFPSGPAALPPIVATTPSQTPSPSPRPPATAAPPSTPSATSTPVPTPTAGQPSPSPSPTVTASPTAEFACRPAAELAAVRPLAVVAPAPWPALPASPELVFLGNRAGNLIHLGFDVEGSPAYLEPLLDVLERRGVKTTMFIVGQWAETYPQWIQAFVARGHELANHTYDHANIKEMGAEAVLAELNRTEEIVFGLTGQSTKPWFRPPFGARSQTSVQTAYSAGWTTVIWTGSSNDWQEGATADSMCQTLRQAGFAGSILYSHTNRPEIPPAVDRFIGEMQSRGFIFVPLSVIMADNGPTLTVRAEP